MITAYADESGIGDTDEFAFVGGFVASDEVWAQFNAAWRKRLVESNLTFFHMSHFKADKLPFCPPVLNRAAHLSLEHDLTKIIEDFGLAGAAVSIDRAAWEKVMTGYRRGFWGECLEKAFYESFYAFWRLKEQLFPEGQPLRLVYGESHLKPDMARLLRSAGDVQKDFPEKISSVTFEVMKWSPGVQAADVLLWEIQEHTKRWKAANEAVPASRNLQKIAKQTTILQIHEENIRAMHGHTFLTTDDMPPEELERLNRLAADKRDELLKNSG